jgi:cytochrome c
MIMRLSAIWKGPLTAMTVGSIAMLALTTWNTNGSAKAPAAPEPPLAGSRIPPTVLSIVERACQDCHSANTHWPWYSKLPPLSWKIHKDVAQARAFMDLSKWNEYTDSERKGYLAAIVASAQARLMPPANYVWLHREARLSDSELRSLKAWAMAERRAMSSKPAPRPQTLSGNQ